jgi:hypothetical protein
VNGPAEEAGLFICDLRFVICDLRVLTAVAGFESQLNNRKSQIREAACDEPALPLLDEFHPGSVKFLAVLEELVDEAALGVDGAPLLENGERSEHGHHAEQDGQAAPKQEVTGAGVTRSGKTS